MHRKLLEASPDIIVVVGGDGRLRYLSPAVTGRLGWSVDDLIGRSAHHLVPPEQIAAFNAALQGVAGPGQRSTDLEFQMLRADGSRLWVDGIVTNLLDDPDVAGIAVNVRDIDARRTLEHQLLTKAFYDDVTGLPARALFSDRLEQMVELSRHDIIVKALFIGIDSFDDLQQGLGFTRVDEVIRQAAARLTEALPSDAMIGRYNSSSFVVISSAVESNRGELVALVRRAFEAPFLIGEVEQAVTASVGLASATNGECGADELLARAEAASHAARLDGPGRAAAFTDRLDVRSRFRETTRAELQRAIDDDELRVHYQPIVDIDSGRIAGLEAFVRWQHPERGLVPPSEFITIADETGLIEPIGNRVIATAVADVGRLNRSARTPLFVAVNLSQRQMAGVDFVSDLRAVLSRSGFAPNLLSFDVTEATLGHAGSLVGSRLRELRNLGIGIAIDDFGAGSSSLLALRDAPVTHVKLDRHFTSMLGRDDEGLVSGVVALAHGLGFSTIAEGVETSEEFDALRRLGCSLSQGWFHSRPMSLDELVGRLAPRAVSPQ